MRPRSLAALSDLLLYANLGRSNTGFLIPRPPGLLGYSVAVRVQRGLVARVQRGSVGGCSVTQLVRSSNLGLAPHGGSAH